MVMETISRTQLARRTREVIEAARRRGPVMVESYGQEQVAVLDALDFRLLRAAATHRNRAARSDAPRGHGAAGTEPLGLTEAEVQACVDRAGGDVQAGWNLVLEAYLTGDTSLGRTAELLRMSRWELQDRLERLGIALQDAPEDMASAVDEAAALRSE